MTSGKIQTVLGLIEPSTLGRTLTHEHIVMDYRKCIEEPRRKRDESKMKSGEITLETLGWIQQNPYCHEFNLAMGDEPLEDIVREVGMFKKEGGSSIVECTTVGLDRDVEVLAQVSTATGLNIIAGAGHFLGCTLPPEVKSASVEELTQVSTAPAEICLSSLFTGHVPTHPFPEACPDPNPTLTQTLGLTQGRVGTLPTTKQGQACLQATSLSTPPLKLALTPTQPLPKP